FCIDYQGIKLLVMGAIRKGGSGCACPENVLLRSLLSEIILNRDEVIIVDMEAGIEHLGRATAKSIDKMIIIVEPGSRSISTAKTIMRMAKEIAIQSLVIVGNKIQDEKQKDWISKKFSQDQILGMISYHEIIRNADLLQQPLIKLLDEKLKREFEKIYQAISLDL
ncbi:unnamed protein product, partial [marine sediment metagenome]